MTPVYRASLGETTKPVLIGYVADDDDDYPLSGPVPPAPQADDAEPSRKANLNAALIGPGAGTIPFTVGSDEFLSRRKR